MFAATVESLDSLAPPGWRVEVARRSDDGGVLRIDSPNDVSGELRVIVCRGLTPRDVVALSEPDEATIVAAEWLSPRSRELLTDVGYGYVDLTGNVGVVVSRPGIVFRTVGAQRDPPRSRCPASTKLRTGRGRGARSWTAMATWFTADLHLGHANIIDYCNRPFADVDAMNRALIDNWNEVVAEDDAVWVVATSLSGRSPRRSGSPAS